jgi:putative membrane protein
VIRAAVRKRKGTNTILITKNQFAMMYFWIILAAIAIAVVWYFNKNNGNAPFISPKKEDTLDILKRRFANGEIDEEEYEERKAVLEEDEYLKYKP